VAGCSQVENDVRKKRKRNQENLYFFFCSQKVAPLYHSFTHHLQGHFPIFPCPQEQNLNFKPQKSKFPAAAKLCPMQNWANICPSTLATASAVRSGPGSGGSWWRGRRRIYFKVHEGRTMQLCRRGAIPGIKQKAKCRKHFTWLLLLKNS